MTLKGEYQADTSYSVGDVVRCSDGFFYYLFKACAAGTTPTDSLYWNRLEEPLASCAKMIMDVAVTIPNNISDEAITLSTETGDYLITVDDSGDTPELTVTAIEEEGAGT